MVQSGSQRDGVSSQRLLRCTCPASAGFYERTFRPFLGCKDPFTPERQLREVIPKGTPLGHGSSGRTWLKTLAVILQEAERPADDVAEAVKGRGR